MQMQHGSQKGNVFALTNRFNEMMKNSCAADQNGFMYQLQSTEGVRPVVVSESGEMNGSAPGTCLAV